jgi:tetraacyldisaccharide 4'-kinase
MLRIIKQWVQYQWRTITPLHLILWPLSWVFIFIAYVRKQILQQRSISIGAPLVVVGNVTAGGNGKTPFVIALANELSARGFKVGIVSRGYGRTYPKTTILISHAMPTTFIGDEAQLISKKTKALVCVSANRAVGAQTLARVGCDLVIADDGLQDYRIRRDLEIGLISIESGTSNGLRIPAGPLREPIHRLLECNYIVQQSSAATQSPACTHNRKWQAVLKQASSKKGSENANTKQHTLVDMYYTIKQLRSLSSGKTCQPQQWRMSRAVNAICAIANPERFMMLLSNAEFIVDLQTLPDHDTITPGQLQNCKGPVFITEKDAAKLSIHSTALADIWVVEIEPVFSNNIFEKIAKQLQKTCAESH